MSPQPRRASPAETTRQNNIHPDGDASRIADEAVRGPRDGATLGKSGLPSGLPWLDWAERRGVLDAALAVALWLQWRVLPLPPCAPTRFYQSNPLAGDSIWGVAVLPLLTWLILAAGALAPLSRRRVPRPGELPPGAGLWLAAYGLLAASWFAILLDTDPMRFWGLAHLARFDGGEQELLALLIPAALAPGWRRLARAIRYKMARVKRQRTKDPSRPHFKFQSSIFKTAGAAALLAAYAWAMTDYAIMSDGFGIVQFATAHQPPSPHMYREPGTMLALKGAARALAPLGLDAAQAIHCANFLAMLGVLGLIGYGMRLMDLNRVQRRVGWWLALSSLGITQMLLGRIELYPLVELAVTATVVFGLGALAGRISPGWMCAVFSFGLAGHLSLIFLLPAVALALWFWTQSVECGSLLPLSLADKKKTAPGSPPGHSRQERPTLARAAAYLLGWGAVVHLPLWGWLMLQLPRPTPAGLVEAVVGSLNTGARGIVETGLGQYTLAGKLARLIQMDTLTNPLQVLFYLAGGALLVAVLRGWVGVCGFLGVGRKGPMGQIGPIRQMEPGGASGGPERDQIRRQAAVLGAAFAGYLVYAYAWPNDWPWSEDWDLFSGITPLAVLLTLRWVMPARGSWGLPAGMVRRICWFALLLGITQHVYNHRYASFLNCIGKITQSPEEGRLIQQYQFDRGWVRGHNYTVENGKVVEQATGIEPGIP